MDKRFFLALILTAIVVAITPLLFPSPAGRSAPTATAGRDSLAGRTPAGRAAEAPGLPEATSLGTPSAGAAQPVAAPAEAGQGGAPSAAAPAETTTVATPKSVYRISSLGAAPVSVVLRDYKRLSAGGKTDELVDLVRPGERLINYRLVVPGDTIRLDRVPFTLAQGAGANASAPRTLTYQAAVANARVAITYSFVPDSYVVRVSGRVEGGATGGAPSFLLVDLPSGINSAEADTVDDHRHLAYALKPQNDNPESIAFDKLDPGETALKPGPLTWVVAKSKYFLVGLLTPTGGQPFAELKVTGGPRTSKQATRASATAVEPLRDGTFAFEMYAGPQEWRRLVALGRDFENANPYGGFLQAIVQPFATLVMRALLWMHEALRLNYGWVLIVFGIVVRLALWPLNQRAMRTSLRMQTIQPQLQAVQERYKSEPQKMQAEIMRVYREHGMSPFSAVSGCFPVLIPMPILITLFFVFQNTIEFRGVPFLWLTDISQHDPYYILPILMAISAYILSWIGLRSAPANPQAKMMSYVFPGMMLIFFYRVAAGLNLYYAVQNIAALPQQWLIANERAKATPTKSPATAKVQGPGTKGRASKAKA
jgi:YidC/Oxa1 family membrane protein insertase